MYTRLHVLGGVVDEICMEYTLSSIDKLCRGYNRTGKANGEYVWPAKLHVLRWVFVHGVIAMTSHQRPMSISSRLANGTPVARPLCLWHRHFEMQVIHVLPAANRVVTFIQIVLLVIAPMAVLLLVEVPVIFVVLI